MTDEQKRIIGKLRFCENDRCVCDECAFADGNVWKWRALMGDAANMIEQQASKIDTLHAENERIRQNSFSHEAYQALLDELEQVKLEREYLLLSKGVDCETCAYKNIHPNGGDKNGQPCLCCDGHNWKWRGVCAENSKTDNREGE